MGGGSTKFRYQLGVNTTIPVQSGRPHPDPRGGYTLLGPDSGEGRGGVTLPGQDWVPPCQGLDGVTPGKDWMGLPPPSKDWMGVPLGDRAAERVPATRRAVCLLRLRRMTLLSLIHYSYRFLKQSNAKQDEMISELRAENRRQVAQIDRLNNLVATISKKFGFEDGTFQLAWGTFTSIKAKSDVD